MYLNNDIDWVKFLHGKDVCIFGAGNQGKKELRRLNKINACIQAFIDNDAKKIGTSYSNVKIISLTDYKLHMSHNNIIVICSNHERDIKQQLLEEGIFNFISISQIDFGGGEDYYDERYFEWQKPLGEFGAKISHKLFAQYVKKNDVLVEFGSAGGYLLNTFDNAVRIGIEINDSARKYAETQGVKCVKTADMISENFADIIISSHVLEHVENPLGELRKLYRILKNGGRMVFYVPNESCYAEYERSEINNHLYTWNCLHIGNLFKAAGFFVHSVKLIQEVWPDNWKEISNEISDAFFDSLSIMGGIARGDKCNNCLIVAYK